MGSVMERKDISGGEWVEIPAWLSHGQMKQVQRIITLSRKNESEMDIQTQMIEVLVKNWSLRDEEDHAIPINKQGIEGISQNIVNEVFEVVSDLVERSSPNG